MNNPSPSTQKRTGEFFSHKHWRENFLKVVLQSSCVLGGLAIFLYLLIQPIPAFILLAVLTYGILIIVTLFTSLPYRLRAGIFLILLYFAGLSSLIDHGIVDASMLFLGFIVMTGLLFPSRPPIYVAIGITFLSILGFGRLNSSLTEWARLTGILILVAMIVAIGLHTFQQEFMKTQEAARQMLDTLQDERSTLEQRVEERTAGLSKKNGATTCDLLYRAYNSRSARFSFSFGYRC